MVISDGPIKIHANEHESKIRPCEDRGLSLTIRGDRSQVMELIRILDFGFSEINDVSDEVSGIIRDLSREIG